MRNLCISLSPQIEVIYKFVSKRLAEVSVCLVAICTDGMSIADCRSVNSFRIVYDMAAFSGYIVLSFDTKVKKVGDLFAVVHQLKEVSSLLRILTGGRDTPCSVHSRTGIKKVGTIADRDRAEVLSGLCRPVSQVAACGAFSEISEHLSLCHGIEYRVAVADGIGKSISFFEPVAMHLCHLFILVGSIPVDDFGTVLYVKYTSVSDIGSIAEGVEVMSVGKLCSYAIAKRDCILRHSALYDLAEKRIIIFRCRKDLRNLNIVFFCQFGIIQEQCAGRSV